MIKIGINGFGRIGRAIYRINHIRKLFDITIINDTNPDIENLNYLLKYDTTYGRFDENISSNNNKLIIGKNSINVFHHNNIADVPWDDHGVDIVIDSSGIKDNINQMFESSMNVKHFILTNAPQGYPDIKTIIFEIK